MVFPNAPGAPTLQEPDARGPHDFFYLIENSMKIEKGPFEERGALQKVLF